MIGLILGTSEGKKILSLLNEFTEDIFVSTATEYGGELLKNYKHKVLNTTPMDYDKMVETIKKYNITTFVDGSHPYALVVTENLKKACNDTGITYLRYERPSVVEPYEKYEDVIVTEGYEELALVLKYVTGNILNTTGSRNIKRVLELNLENRIIHRVLPTLKVMQELDELKIMPEDIVAIKGPISYELNKAFIEEHDAKAILMKDSGVQGGTEEKLRAALDSGIKAVVIGRKKIKEEDNNIFYSVEEVVSYIRENN
ncbi:cobalt-precorrin-6A reductase [Hathewaya massiliensis]|uniref:cobalt-precorrin-6A reductase n=1 Tax=Hathewaya massiliensis TaxID=1964382 RepID=UPI001158D0F4|nr:cobalt-precorrin-6A reductase [Hathewaya massiliensis]